MEKPTSMPIASKLGNWVYEPKSTIRVSVARNRLGNKLCSMLVVIHQPGILLPVYPDENKTNLCTAQYNLPMQNPKGFRQSYYELSSARMDGGGGNCARRFGPGGLGWKNFVRSSC